MSRVEPVNPRVRFAIPSRVTFRSRPHRFPRSPALSARSLGGEQPEVSKGEGKAPCRGPPASRIGNLDRVINQSWQLIRL